MAKISPEVYSAIVDAAREFNVPADAMFAVAAQESRFQAGAKNPRSSATGLYQHIDSTWNDVTSKYGGRYGITSKTPRTDPRASALMGAALMADNIRQLQSANLPVTPASIYMAHFAGIKGAVKALTAPSAKPASAVFGNKVVAANPFMRGKTIEEVRSFFENKMQAYVDEYAPATPANMNMSGIGWSGSIAPDIAPIEPEQSAYTPRDQFGQLAAIPTPRPDPYASRMADQYGNYRQSLATIPDMLSAPGGIIDTGRTIVDGMDYTRAAADLQPGFDRYEADRNVMRSIPEMPSVPGGLFDARLEMAPGSMPAYSVNDRFADYQAPAPNSPEKAFENAVRNSYFDGLVNQPAPAPAPTRAGFTPSSPMGATSRTPSGSFTPSSPFSNGLAPAGGLTQEPSPSLASQYAAYGAGTSTTNRAPNDPRAAGYRSLAPAPTYAAAVDRIDIPNSAVAPTAMAAATVGDDERGSQRTTVADYVAPQTAASATQAAPAPKPSETIQRQAVAAPAMTAAPRTVAPRTVTPYTPPAPTMTPERAKALGMVPTLDASGKVVGYMPDVKANPAQVMRDQMGLIARNPIESLFNMAVGALQGGVFYDRIPGLLSSVGGLFGGSSGSDATPERTREAYGGSLGGLGGSYTGPGGVGGYTGGGFQASPGGWGNYGSSGSFNSGFQTGSGFTYDR